MQPRIVFPEYGTHNADLHLSSDRIKKGSAYKDASTICVIPTRGGRSLLPRVVQSWFGLFTPMNQKFMRLFMEYMEVGAAYDNAVEAIISHPELSKWKYVLTLEDDNIPPPDGLLKLIQAIEGGVDGRKYDAVGGLYWTKGHGGQPMIYGNPDEFPVNFIPQVPVQDTIQRCNGLGTGFTLFRLSMLKHKDLTKPIFETVQKYIPGVGSEGFTQDLRFFHKAGQLGFKFACDTRVKVGHYDEENDIVW